MNRWMAWLRGKLFGNKTGCEHIWSGRRGQDGLRYCILCGTIQHSADDDRQ